MTADLIGDQPEQVQRVGMVRFDRQYLAVKRLGLGQPPGLMVANGLVEQDLNGGVLEPSLAFRGTTLFTVCQKCLRSGGVMKK